MTRPARRPGLRERARYRFDRFMERGTIALIAGLFGLSLAIIVGVVLLLVVIRGDDGRDIPQLLWMALLRTLDPGTMGGDQGTPGFVLGMLLVTFGGIFVISALIGILTAGLEGRLGELRKGRSRVLEHDHVLILGWSQQIFTVISELIEAGASRARTSIVVLADRDRVEMEDAIRARVAIPRRARVVCRTGRPTDLSDLPIANPDEARTIVILESEGDDPDVDVVKTILALTGRPDRRAEPYRIVAEVRERASADIARLVGGDEVHLLLADELIARIVAQTCRQSGLSVVYQELLDFAGNELHVERLPELVGRTFGEAVTRVVGGIPAGIVRGGRAQLCPPPHEEIRADDLLVVLSEDHGSAAVAPEAAVVEASALRGPRARVEPRERTLILGWNRRGPTVIGELDQYVAPGSEVLAVSSLARVVHEVDAINGLANLRADGQVGDTTNRAVLDGLDLASYDHVVVLCESDDRDAEAADARTLVTLLHLRDMGAKLGRPFSIVSEMLDVRNRELAEVAKADDFIVSARVLSLLLAQIAETPELADVFRDLFDADGAEAYLRDAADYVELDREVSFATLQAAAQGRDEVALGYRMAARADDVSAAYGVVLNPDRNARISLTRGDRLVVLAER
jgi:voltage-gated potassium channel Kch